MRAGRVVGDPPPFGTTGPTFDPWPAHPFVEDVDELEGA